MPNRRFLCRRSRVILLGLSLIFVSISFSWLPVSAEDSIPPYIIDINVKPDNRVELGETPFFEVILEDKSGINQVLIEYEGANHSMKEMNIKQWVYDSWTPKAMGGYVITIHAEDNLGNWAHESTKIEIVLDATPPEVDIIDKPEREIEGGSKVLISVLVNDTYEILQVLFEFRDILEPMINIPDSNIWEYELLSPSDGGVYIYIIHVEDINHNWNYTSGSIEVIDIPIAPDDESSNISGLLLIIFSIIGLTIGVSLVLSTRKSKRLGDQSSIRSTQMIEDQTTLIQQQYLLRSHKRIVNIRCPTCSKIKGVPLSVSVPSDSGGLCSVYVSKNVVCEHSFQIYVDKFQDIRGSEPVDYSLGEEIK